MSKAKFWLNPFFLKIITLIIIIGIWIKQTYLPLTSSMMVNEADAYTRLRHVVNSPMSQVWLPGFKYVMKFFSVIKDNGTFFNYRLGIYIYTLFLALVIFLIIKNITKSFLPSLLGLTIFLFHPLTRQLSTITLTEIPWLFFLFLSIYFLFFTKYKNKIWLGLLAFIISQTVRYESWFLILPLIFYLFFFLKRKNVDFVDPILLTILFPIFWILVLDYIYDNPISFIFEKLKCSQESGFISHWTISNLTNCLNSQLDTYIFPHIILIFVILIGLVLKKAKLIPISVISIYLYICFFIETFITFNENTSPRFFYYLVPSLSILIPTCLYLIFYKYSKNLKLILYGCCYFILVAQMSTLNQNEYFNVNQLEIKDIKETLKNLDPAYKTYICVDQLDMFYSGVLEYSLQYKNIDFGCQKDFYEQDQSSKMVISTQNESYFDSKINYIDKKELSTHTIYSF
jgi:hypothetical protein